jgi:long-chain acyl-CoA synthetase
MVDHSNARRDGSLGELPSKALLTGQTLCEAFQASASRQSNRPALRSAETGRTWNWGECAREVQRLAGAMAAMDVQPGDTVAFLLRNRPEFNLLDAAALHIGATPWSIYLTSAPEQIRQVVEGAGSKVVFCERDLLPKLTTALDGGATDHIVDVEELDRLPAAPEGFDFERRWRAVDPGNALTLIWTSGTTGAPKPVVLTHKAMLSVLAAVTEVSEVSSGGRLVSYLPSAHVGDRWSAHCWWMSLGAELTTVADSRTVMAALPGIRPTIFGSVPRIWEKLRSALEAQGVTDPRALSAAAAAALREKLGLDKIEFLGVGAAPLAAETLTYFEDLGLPICELWGMSETCGVLTLNPPNARRTGTVGSPLPGVELRLAADGEVLARGPMLMAGYLGRPDLTAEAIVDGWLHTGDIGSLDDVGYLSIVDRKKELIINSAGKNMSPLAIEAALKTAGPLIGQACVIGDRRPYNVALLLLEPDAASAWARNAGREGTSYSELARDPEIQSAIAQEVEAANARLSRVEQIKRWCLLEADWLPDEDELTPTMKLKRRRISEKYSAVIDGLYA